MSGCPQMFLGARLDVFPVCSLQCLVDSISAELREKGITANIRRVAGLHSFFMQSFNARPCHSSTEQPRGRSSETSDIIRPSHY